MPQLGDKKFKKKFLLLPRIPKHGWKMRWLQWATLEYVYCQHIRINDFTAMPYVIEKWSFNGFVDEVPIDGTNISGILQSWKKHSCDEYCKGE
jgi:hypothetical protein